MTEFLTLDTPGRRDKSTIIETFPDYDAPSTSYDVPLNISNAVNRGYESTGEPQSSIEHDHQYCSSGENVVEIEVSTSPNDYDESKLMPRPVSISSLKKRDDQEEEIEEYLFASSKDEELARKFGLPVSAAEIINMPVNEFGVLLKNPSLTPMQTDLIRKIRRRGRNKVAAQNCRQRRMDDLQQLNSEVDQLEQERDTLLRRQRDISTLKSMEQKRINDLITKRQRKL